LLHVIDAASPLAGETSESLSAARGFMLLSVNGTDVTTGHRLMARQEYPASTLRWNYGYVDILSTDADGIDHFDYARFHDIEPLS
jgi:inward rectifier potassium channel